MNLSVTTGFRLISFSCPQNVRQLTFHQTAPFHQRLTSCTEYQADEEEEQENLVITKYSSMQEHLPHCCLPLEWWLQFSTCQSPNKKKKYNKMRPSLIKDQILRKQNGKRAVKRSCPADQFTGPAGRSSAGVNCSSTFEVNGALTIQAS